MALQFDRYAQEGNLFLKNLSGALGHPEEIGRTGMILRAVLHTLRERISIAQSLNLLSQLPMFLKGIYVDNWKYNEKPLTYTELDDFTEEVKKHQAQYGEQEYDWQKSTREIIGIVLNELRIYLTKGEAESIVAELPKEIKEFFKESMYA